MQGDGKSGAVSPPTVQHHVSNENSGNPWGGVGWGGAEHWFPSPSPGRLRPPLTFVQIADHGLLLQEIITQLLAEPERQHVVSERAGGKDTRERLPFLLSERGGGPRWGGGGGQRAVALARGYFAVQLPTMGRRGTRRVCWEPEAGSNIMNRGLAGCVKTQGYNDTETCDAVRDTSPLPCPPRVRSEGLLGGGASCHRIWASVPPSALHEDRPSAGEPQVGPPHRPTRSGPPGWGRRPCSHPSCPKVMFSLNRRLSLRSSWVMWHHFSLQAQGTGEGSRMPSRSPASHSPPAPL